MIYLIGGPPKCGKTTLAKELAQKLHVSWISADTIQNIVKIHTPPKEQPLKFPSSHHKTNSNDERFRKFSTSQLVTDYIKQSTSSYDAIKMLVETYLVDEDDFIIEGYQVTPKLVDQIHIQFGWQNIRAVFLVNTDQETFIKNIHKSTTPNDWIVRRTVDPETTFPLIAKMIRQYSDLIKAESLKYGHSFYEMSLDFDTQKNKALALLCDGNGGSRQT